MRLPRHLKIKVELDDIEAILDEIKALPTHTIGEDDLILVDRAAVGEILSRHVHARWIGDD